MKLFTSAEERAQITEQLSRLLRQALSQQPGISKQDVVAYTSYGNAMLVIHTHDFHCVSEMKDMLDNLQELSPHVQKTSCREAERMLDIMIAHLKERITDETFEHRR